MTYLTLREKNPLDGLFEDFWTLPSRGAAASAWAPATDIDENDDHFLLTVEVPGVKREDIAIELEKDVGRIRGGRKDEERKGLYAERRWGNFERTFSLPAHVDAQKIEAKLENGLLFVKVPKAEIAKPRQIEIK